MRGHNAFRRFPLRGLVVLADHFVLAHRGLHLAGLLVDGGDGDSAAVDVRVGDSVGADARQQAEDGEQNEGAVRERREQAEELKQPII